MTKEIKQALLREKRERNDQSRYVGELLIRQREINSRVVNFAQEFLGEKARIIDACAGPEGSLLPSTLRGYRWFGNDISYKFAAHLKRTGAPNIVISDFADCPYQNASFNGALFIFALNNISRTNKALSEASRLVESGGLTVVSDPGPTMWVTNILLHSLLDNDRRCSALIRNRVFAVGIPEYFASSEYTESDYADFVVKETLGLTKKDLKKSTRQLIREMTIGGKNLKSLPFYFQELIVKTYFDFVHKSAERAGFTLVKAGFMSTAKDQYNEWPVSEPLQLSTQDWLDKFIWSRRYLRRAKPNLPEVFYKSSRVITFPILCFRKETPKA